MNYLYPTQYPAGLNRLFRQDAGSVTPGQYALGQFAANPYSSGQFAAGPFVPGQYMPGAVPSMSGYPDVFLEDRQSFDDARRLQSFYPRIAQEIQRLVEEECDKMEYEGSMMFDEYPDRLMMRKLAEDIAVKIKAENPEEWDDFAQDVEAASEDTLAMQATGWDRDRNRDRRGRRRRGNWLGDLTQVILLDEMHRRRCRHRRCRDRRFW